MFLRCAIRGDCGHGLKIFAPLCSQLDSKVLVMPASDCQLNRLERLLFRAALALAGLLIVARIGAILLLTILHHSR
jgi:hypothetical protein